MDFRLRLDKGNPLIVSQVGVADLVMHGRLDIKYMNVVEIWQVNLHGWSASKGIVDVLLG